jgi:hypothetical protein
MVLEGAAIRRPHLYGFNQAKREALGIKNLNKALDPNSTGREMLIASRNCIAMEAQEQALLAREKAPEPAPASKPVTAIIQRIVEAVHHIPEARELIAERLRVTALEIQIQALANDKAG